MMRSCVIDYIATKLLPWLGIDIILPPTLPVDSMILMLVTSCRRSSSAAESPDIPAPMIITSKWSSVDALSLKDRDPNTKKQKAQTSMSSALCWADWMKNKSSQLCITWYSIQYWSKCSKSSQEHLSYFAAASNRLLFLDQFSNFMFTPSIRVNSERHETKPGFLFHSWYTMVSTAKPENISEGLLPSLMGQSWEKRIHHFTFQHYKIVSPSTVRHWTLNMKIYTR